MIMQSAKRTGIFRQQCLPSRSESFVRGAVSTPEQSTSYSDARVSSSAETIDLVTPDLIQGTPPNAACYAPEKRKLQFRGF